MRQRLIPTARTLARSSARTSSSRGSLGRRGRPEETAQTHIAAGLLRFARNGERTVEACGGRYYFEARFEPVGAGRAAAGRWRGICAAVRTARRRAP